MGQEEILVGVGTLKVDGTSVGNTEDGVTLDSARDYYDVEADQSINVLRKVKIKEVVTVKTNILESTLVQIRMVWDVGNSLEESGGYTKLSFGGDTTVTEHTLEFNGTRTNGKTRKFVAFKAVSVESGEHSYKKGDKTLIPVSFELIADASQPSGKQLGYYEDED